MNFRFHVLGIPHAKTTREYSCEAFTQKVRVFCKMMTENNHTIYHYGTEGSDPICTEHISVLSNETFEKVHGTYDYKKDGFIKTDQNNDAYREFIKNAIIEINKRKQTHDFLICSYGHSHKPIADGVNIITVELGIGYMNSFAQHRIFESYEWMHYVYGTEKKINTPHLYDAVIPNYYDLNDFVYKEEKEDYFFFIGRPTFLKGLDIAAKTVEHLGVKLIVAGQGEPPVKSKNIEFVGVVNIEERARLMSSAKATFVPTLYLEPFGSVVIESLLCGTPVISTDFGAFPSLIPHGKVGYRCRTLEQFIWAAKNIVNIKPSDCREWAVKNFSMERVRKMYEEYFSMVHYMWADEKGWYRKDDARAELDWLNKDYL
jgi:glycosyltransferase involved in cell wall biosynthesis